MRPSTIRVRVLAAVAMIAVLAMGMGAAAVTSPLPVLGEAVPGWAVPAALALVLLLLLGAADRVLQHVVIEPVERMTDDAEAIAEGAYDRRVQTVDRPELRRLSRAINAVADRLLQEREVLAENIESLERTNRALTEARDELVQAEKMASVGRMAAGLAHEIGNPLNSVLSYAEIGRRRGTDGEWLDGITEEAGRIDRIIQGLLDYARPGEGAEGEHEVAQVVRDTIDLLNSQGRLEGIDVSFTERAGAARVLASRVHLQQILMNLLLNAIDALEESERPAGERAIEVSTSLEEYEGMPETKHRPRRSDDPEEVDYSHLRRFQSSPSPLDDRDLAAGDPVVVVTVEDTGPGLTVEDPHRLFDPFFTTKDPGRGTGLGLAVSARLVSRMGGVIEAEDRPDGPGSMFRVLLPRHSDSSGEDES